MTNSNTEAVGDTRIPHLVHTARVMFETRWAKYNDPHNLDWDFDADMARANKWERHAWSAYLDLIAAEHERDSLLAENGRLRKAIEAEAARRAYTAGLGVSEWEAFLWPEAMELPDPPEKEQKQ